MPFGGKEGVSICFFLIVVSENVGCFNTGWPTVLSVRTLSAYDYTLKNGTSAVIQRGRVKNEKFAKKLGRPKTNL